MWRTSRSPNTSTTCTAATIPSPRRPIRPACPFALDESLLGPHRFCSLGFEPVNFNTGNFFLQTADFSLPDLGTSALEIVRTYNTQSSENDGPLAQSGPRNTSQHLRLFNDGAWATAARTAAKSSSIISRTERS